MEKSKRLILHICCAPDATVPVEALTKEGYIVEGFFYGGNIHPEEEFEKRAAAVSLLCESEGIRCPSADYDPEEWFSETKALAAEPEGGRRCPLCFELQLTAAARYASSVDARYLTTTLTISPHKDPSVINEIGETIASKFGLEWVARIWRKKDGFVRSVKKSKKIGLYRQNYCGCIYSVQKQVNDVKEKNELPSGKLSPEALKRNVLRYIGAERKELLVGPAVGEDAAVIEWPAGKYLVFSSDPIVGAEKGAGRLLVRINSNDIASKGGDPAYLAVTLILPPSLGEEGAARIMSEIHEECLAQGIAVAGGHTEFNDRYERPVIMGALIGTADRVLRADDLRRGDVLIATKHVGIEGMSILAADKPELLRPFMSEHEISELLSWSEKILVLEESIALRGMASFMHDPTEGGFMGGIGEISSLSGLNIELDCASVPIHPLTVRAAEKLHFDPMRLIASGSLLAAVPSARKEEALEELKKINVEASIVGIIGGKLQGPVPEPSEELWRLLKMEGVPNG